MIGTQMFPMDNLIPFDDTYVLYDPNDIVSFISCYFSLLPIAILVFYFSWFVTNREMEAVFIAIGHLMNEILNNVVKNVIREPRPNNFGTFQKETLRSGFGMPSAHSQFMGFFALYHCMRIWLQWTGLRRVHKVLGSVAVVIATTCVAGSRVYLGYHDVPQVLVGVSIGAFLGSLYFLLVGLIRHSGLSDWVLTWRLAKWFLVKDSCYHAPISLREEYEAYWRRRSRIEGPGKTE
ncbi:ACL186Wp [Eremothecium gossypii ATCC 10895]|uniref:ACL186Wp n=1 Tax=Eremothecium gossypii (strain ATCC 10895 / CBS 109.51 / FGSC 9923 / NRRL Y-1056) TaxID=284811 RepID=Q75CV2_EREGS|nr:ACL186Wp [Eremothecium gossypii ATCC 10895]AAS51042.1 ACL186Wp [Eremothecium gossypii ATCC 10895]AEY95332.1 FACL186Wp [Eremothecium gossypii FDAG1]